MGSQQSLPPAQPLTLETPNASKFVGALLGMGIGDYCGAIVEGNTPVQCREQFSRIKKVLSSVSPTLSDSKNKRELVSVAFSEFNGHFPFGQITDDTQLAREVALAILQSAESDGGDIEHFKPSVVLMATRMAQLYKEHRMVGCGPTTSVALTKLIKGASSSESGGPGLGNGPLARSTSLGLLFWDAVHIPDIFTNSLIPVTVEQSRVTHSNPMCGEAAVCHAAAIALAMSASHPLSSSAFIDSLCTLMAVKGSTTVLPKLEELRTLLSLAPKQAAKRIAFIGCDPSYARTENKDGGINGDAISSLIWALYCFLRSPEKFITTLETAISGGGDTDSTAAFACGLSGAYVGRNNLPEALVLLMDDQGQKAEEVEDIATKLYSLAMQRSNISRKTETVF